MYCYPEYLLAGVLTCLLVEDEVEDLTGETVFKLGKGEGYAGSECYTDENGGMVCSDGRYFQSYDGCE